MIALFSERFFHIISVHFRFFNYTWVYCLIDRIFKQLNRFPTYSSFHWAAINIVATAFNSFYHPQEVKFDSFCSHNNRFIAIMKVFPAFQLLFMVSEQILIVLYLRPTQNRSQVEINGQNVWIMIVESEPEVQTKQEMRNRFKEKMLSLLKS